MREPGSGRRAPRDSQAEPRVLTCVSLSLFSLYGVVILINYFMGWGPSCLVPEDLGDDVLRTGFWWGSGKIFCLK